MHPRHAGARRNRLTRWVTGEPAPGRARGAIEPRFGAESSIALFRTGQEALAVAARHDEAKALGFHVALAITIGLAHTLAPA
jgi:hypothetical protein